MIPTRARRRPLPAPAASGPLPLPLPTAWARERITAAGGELPDYGSPEWHALADENPRKLAAALVAAEAHRYETETLADRLAREIAENRYWAEAAALHEAIADGARRAMRRDEQLAEHTRKVVDAAARRLLSPPPPPFTDPVEVVDSEGWPPVRRPGTPHAS